MEYDNNSIDFYADQSRLENLYWRRRRETTRTLLALMVVALLSVAMIFLLPAYKTLLDREGGLKAAQLEGMQEIPNLQEKLDIIEKQITILSTKSIEERLSKIEKTLSVGDLDANQIGDFSSLQQRVSTMETYMFEDPRELVELKELQNDYHALSSSLEKFATKEAVNSDIENLRWMVGLGLGFVGVLFTIFFGSWWFVGRHPKTEPQPTRPLHDAPKEEEQS